MEDTKKVFFGKVCWFNSKKGYGFIEWSIDNVKQKDLFLHFSDIQMEGYKTVKPDQKLSFEIGQNRHGDPKAISVKLVND